MTSSRHETSLERFARTRGAQMLGYSQGRVASTIQIAIGGALTAVGLGLLVAPVFGAPPEVAIGALGPGLAGGINLAIGAALRRRFQGANRVTVELSPNARALLLRLVRQSTGWGFGMWPANNWGMYGGPFAYGPRHRIRHQIIANMWQADWQNANSMELDDDLLDLLDRAAHEFNRIAAVLSSGASASGTLAKIAPRLAVAADEGMAEALHHGASIADYPEGAKAAVARVEATIKSLKELADRVEELAGQEPTLMERTAYRSGLDEVLDELRLDQLARAELRTTDDKQEGHVQEGS